MALILRHIRYLMAVAEHRNFTRAAEALHVSQPTLSQQIRQLEDSLGSQLLDRSGRSVRLTDEGEVFLDHARRALLLFESGRRAIREVNDLTRGEIRIGMTPPVAFFMGGALLMEFSRLYPGIRIHADELSQDAIEQAIVERTIDLGLAFGDALSPEAVYSSEIDAQELCTQGLRLLVGLDHPLAGREGPVQAAELAELEFALLTPAYALRQHVERYCAEQRVRLNLKFESNSLGLLLRAVAGGRLVTLSAGDVRNSGKPLRELELLPAPPSRTVVLLRRHGAFERAACKAFGEVAQRVCVASPAA